MQNTAISKIMFIKFYGRSCVLSSTSGLLYVEQMATWIHKTTHSPVTKPEMIYSISFFEINRVIYVNPNTNTHYMYLHISPHKPHLIKSKII